MFVHERLNDAPAVDSAQFRVILDPNEVAEKLVGAAKVTAVVVWTELTEFSPADTDTNVIVYVPACTPVYTATFPVMTGTTPISGDDVRVNPHPGVASDHESVAVEPKTLCWKFVGVDGVTEKLFTLVELLVTPPHTDTKVKLYVPHPSDRINGGFPRLLEDPVAAPVHVRLICAPGVADTHERVALLFKLSAAVNDVGIEGATEIVRTVLYDVSPKRVAPTWNEYVPGERVTVNGLVVGTNVVPPVLIVNVQLGVVSAQEILMDPEVGVTVIIGVAGWITVTGNTGDDATPRIPRNRQATLKLNMVDVPGVNTVPEGYGNVATPTESTEANDALFVHVKK